MKFFALVLAFSLFGFSAQALEVGDVAQDFTLHQIASDNSESDKSILKTNAPGQFLLLEFATTWCSHCQANVPVVSKLAEELSETTTVRIIFVDAEEAARAQVQENRALFNFDVALDSQKVAWRGGYSTGAVPTTYVIDRDGKVIFKHTGSLAPAILDQLRALLIQR